MVEMSRHREVLCKLVPETARTQNQREDKEHVIVQRVSLLEVWWATGSPLGFQPPFLNRDKGLRA